MDILYKIDIIIWSLVVLVWFLALIDTIFDAPITMFINRHSKEQEVGGGQSSYTIHL